MHVLCWRCQYLHKVFYGDGKLCHEAFMSKKRQGFQDSSGQEPRGEFDSAGPGGGGLAKGRKGF